ncbi:MAG: hypothetical protein PHV49_04465, partial [Alistipes sp.]|nr:hypothetical protein [Alistipes sp.]
MKRNEWRRGLWLLLGWPTLLWGQTPLEIPEALPGWDIYTGGVYRYGPSIMVHDKRSIDIWFAAPGDLHGKNLPLFVREQPHHPQAISGTTTVAQRFEAKQPFWAVGVTSPNWSGKPCGLTLSLYRWDAKRSYAQNIAMPPVAVQRYTDYADGARLTVSNDQLFAAGTYLWVLSEGAYSHSGVWESEGTLPGVVSYRNGKPMERTGWVAYCVQQKSDGSYFWDQASYQHSKDGGRTWTPEKMVLLPTEYASDHFSVCDPGVAFWGGYYYIGYTSTENKGMVENHVYICRSKDPEGPWEKWNGQHWTTGTDVQPMIRYTDDPTRFGAGEPCMVVMGDTLYFYYTWNGTGDERTTTRLVTASTQDSLWPAHLTYHGTVINKSKLKGADHCDVKYREDLGVFQAIHTVERMSARSYIMVWESADGIHFQPKGEIRKNLKPYLHNCGWSGDERGHIL